MFDDNRTNMFDDNRTECYICSNITFLYKLECGHEFCMSCIKRIYMDKISKKCPSCRARISRQHFAKIIDFPENIRIIGNFDKYLSSYSHIWLYKGRNIGWWIFDLEFQDILEKSYGKEEPNLILNICGNQVNIDFKQLIQRNTVNNSIRAIKRVIKKDLSKLLVKGLSGMK